MPSNSASTPILNKPARCQHRSSSGRQCRSHATSSSSELCPHHSTTAPVRNTNFKDALTRHAYNFQRPQGVNNSLAVLYALLAEGRISPRRASVLAYISSLLLRTIPAINEDNENYVYNDEESDPPATSPSTPSAANTACTAANGDDLDEEDEDDINEEEEEEGPDVEEEEVEDEEDDNDDDEEATYAHSERASQIVQPTPVPPGREPLPETPEAFANAALKTNPG